jgi:hypothetical protein
MSFKQLDKGKNNISSYKNKKIIIQISLNPLNKKKLSGQKKINKLIRNLRI